MGPNRPSLPLCCGEKILLGGHCPSSPSHATALCLEVSQGSNFFVMLLVYVYLRIYLVFLSFVHSRGKKDNEYCQFFCLMQHFRKIHSPSNFNYDEELQFFICSFLFRFGSFDRNFMFYQKQEQIKFLNISVRFFIFIYFFYLFSFVCYDIFPHHF